MKRFIALLLLVPTVIACEGAGDEGDRASVDVRGNVHAGPVCPVESVPPDPACADRPVVGAVLLIVGSDGSAITEVETDANGEFVVALPAGSYVLVPQPVDGLIGTAEPQPFVASLGSPDIDVRYDTGIR